MVYNAKTGTFVNRISLKVCGIKVRIQSSLTKVFYICKNAISDISAIIIYCYTFNDFLKIIMFNNNFIIYFIING